MISKSEYRRLNIQSPPHWNEYDAYLLLGGKLEYADWMKADRPFNDVWGNKTPTRIKMLKDVRSDLPFMLGVSEVAFKDKEYNVEANPYGAVSIVFESGEKLGVKPDEFEVVEFKESK